MAVKLNFVVLEWKQYIQFSPPLKVQDLHGKIHVNTYTREDLTKVH